VHAGQLEHELAESRVQVDQLLMALEAERAERAAESMQALLAAQQAEHLEARLRAELVAAESSHAGIDVEAASPGHSSVEGACGMGLAADLQAELAARSCELAAARVREESLRSELQQALSLNAQHAVGERVATSAQLSGHRRPEQRADTEVSSAPEQERQATGALRDAAVQHEDVTGVDDADTVTPKQFSEVEEEVASELAEELAAVKQLATYREQVAQMEQLTVQLEAQLEVQRLTAMLTGERQHHLENLQVALECGARAEKLRAELASRLEEHGASSRAAEVLSSQQFDLQLQLVQSRDAQIELLASQLAERRSADGAPVAGLSAAGTQIDREISRDEQERSHGDVNPEQVSHVELANSDEEGERRESLSGALECPLTLPLPRQIQSPSVEVVADGRRILRWMSLHAVFHALFLIVWVCSRSSSLSDECVLMNSF